MAVKYHCPNCGIRFVDWGAEKMGFKCPKAECKGEPLILIGAGDEDMDDKPHLKRSKKRKAVVPPVSAPMDIDEIGESFVEPDDMDVEEEDEAELEEEEDSPIVVADDADVVDDDVLLDEEDDVVDEDDGSFADALDIEGDDIPIDEE